MYVIVTVHGLSIFSFFFLTSSLYLFVVLDYEKTYELTRASCGGAESRSLRGRIQDGFCLLSLAING